MAPGAHLRVRRVDDGSGEPVWTCLGARLGMLPRGLVGWTEGATNHSLLLLRCSRLTFSKFLQLTWIIVRDELMCVLFASFSVGVLVLVPVGCLWIIPECVLDLDSYEEKLAVKFTANYL